jgi:ferrous iron transport protein B
VTVTVALLGNPNTGKSTIFSALCGVRQRVGNYPGVTVEKTLGFFVFGDQQFTLIDLPGTYSLAPRSLDEMVAVDVLLGRRDDVTTPEILLCIVDAANLERNLYLISQALELNRPLVIALNRVDVAAEKGIELNVELIARRLGVPIIPTQAHRKIGLDALRHALRAAIDSTPPPPAKPFPAPFRREVAALEARLARDGQTPLPRYLVERLLLDTGGYLENAVPPIVDRDVLAEVHAARSRLAEAGHPVPAVEAIARYDWVHRMLNGAVKKPASQKLTWSDRLDILLMHKVWGTVIFVLMMVIVFQAIFIGAAPLMDALDGAAAWLGGRVEAVLPPGALRSLLVDGVIAGVGGVLVFLPQIMILFLFIAVLEDCGYMARAAYLMDRLMTRVGLSGKSFIPLLSSFACAIPGIMATRTIEDRRDRLLTILIAPLMSCSARLPVYALLTAAFIPNRTWLGGWLRLQGMTLFAMYALGIVSAICVAWVFRRTFLRGDVPPFVMELHSYKWPSPRVVLTRVLDGGWTFVRNAGTLILAVSIIVWAAAYFPRDPDIERQIRARYSAALEPLEREIAMSATAQTETPGVRDAQRLERLQAAQQELRAQMANEVSSANLEHSALGRAGRAIAPVVRPLGWDWRIGCAVIASFPAREIVIGTLNVLYQLGGEDDVHADSLRDTLRSATWPGTDRPVFTIPVALSIMVFFALCAQCAATLAVIRRETDSWRWPLFTFAYMTTLAYVAALLTYQVGSRLIG